MNSFLLVSHAAKSECIEPLKFTSSYLDECKHINEDNRHLVWGKRSYNIPVLNRDNSVNFSCLVTNLKKQKPGIYLSCDHHGLKVEADFIQPRLFWGERQDIGALWGLFLSGILIIPIIVYINSKIFVGVSSFFLGAFCLIPGVLFLKISKKIRNCFR